MIKITIDTTKLTLGEMEDFEAAAGASIGELARITEGKETVKLTDVPVKMLTALAWIFARRENPTLTLAAVRDTQLTDLEFTDPFVDAGTAASSGSSRPSATSTSSRRRRSGV
ncbi:MAG: hypothetical protein ACKVVT_15095 [Dehalococcoidia bacterium]